MKEKYEDLLYRVVSKHYPYVKRIDFLVGRAQHHPLVGEHCDDLTVIVHIDTDMISPHHKEVSELEDYSHDLFFNGVEEISVESYRLDNLIYSLTTPFTKLVPTNDDDPFMPESFIQYLKYDIMS
jgi:hypothetical protein